MDDNDGIPPPSVPYAGLFPEFFDEPGFPRCYKGEDRCWQSSERQERGYFISLAVQRPTEITNSFIYVVDLYKMPRLLSQIRSFDQCSAGVLVCGLPLMMVTVVVVVVPAECLSISSRQRRRLRGRCTCLV
jgi:hypothetical protein